MEQWKEKINNLMEKCSNEETLRLVYLYLEFLYLKEK